jgi:hypothetical protein
MARRVNPHDWKLLDLLLTGRPEELDPTQRARRYAGDVEVWESDREITCRLAKRYVDDSALDDEERDRIRRVWIELEPYVPEPDQVPLSRRVDVAKAPA